MPARTGAQPGKIYLDMPVTYLKGVGPARAEARAGPTAILPSDTRAPTVTTTSRSSTSQRVTAAFMASANADAREQAGRVPSARYTAAANAARSAADCARWRAITADPTYTPPMVIASKTAIIATATRLAEPRSARTRLGRRDRLRGDGDARQQRRLRGDPRDHELAIAP